MGNSGYVLKLDSVVQSDGLNKEKRGKIKDGSYVSTLTILTMRSGMVP